MATTAPTGNARRGLSRAGRFSKLPNWLGCWVSRCGWHFWTFLGCWNRLNGHDWGFCGRRIGQIGLNGHPCINLHGLDANKAVNGPDKLAITLRNPDAFLIACTDIDSLLGQSAAECLHAVRLFPSRFDDQFIGWEVETFTACLLMLSRRVGGIG